MLIDDWIGARNAGGEAEFFLKLQPFGDFFSSPELMNELPSRMDFARRQLVVQLMYLATHVVLVQTDYMSKPSILQIVAYRLICQFLLVGIELIHHGSVLPGANCEVVGECISVFSQSHEFSARCSGLWRVHIMPADRYPPVKASSKLQAVSADHFLAVLLQIYCAVLATGEGRLRTINMLRDVKHWPSALHENICRASALALKIRIRCIDGNQCDVSKDITYGSEGPLFSLFQWGHGLFHSTQVVD